MRNTNNTIVNGPAILVRPESYVEQMDTNALFLKRQPLEVELGSGDGSFLVEYARMHPERNFIGVERLLGRIKKLDKKGRRAGLTNLKAISIEAGYFIQYLLPCAVVSTLHVYFPDPWPKKKHRNRRLISAGFPGLAKRVLAPGGICYFRTDSEDYSEQISLVFSESPDFKRTETPWELADIQTDFEKEFRSEGKNVHYHAYELAS
ncbi:MAG: tRNA (guanosine(46)-N7)-methyltransferase TrmB [Verrucomicrobia bacterium]|nr:tRNA (guanosine(46)-N7)-methyltransferase TrmB [Verrucomicrobiota bacterium]MCF7707673.1 tRNA (guanosine(46)-N7)-methyltransferase TrmB [Verrucomicrobiota bacterium]